MKKNVIVQVRVKGVEGGGWMGKNVKTTKEIGQKEEK